VKENYKKALFFDSAFPIIEKIFYFENDNLFDFTLNSLKSICSFLDIKTPIVVSSTLNIDHTLKAQSKVITLCKTAEGTQYINPIGGLELYNRKDFENERLDLSFIKSRPIAYRQFSNNFVPWLSVLDLLMFNSPEQIKLWLSEFDEIRN
jgi:hypothetical protein